MYLQVARHLRDKLLGVVVDGGVEVDVGGVPESLDLLLQSLVDPGVTVTNRHSDNTSKHVQILPALLIIQILPLTRVNQQRHSVVGQHSRTQIVLSDLSNSFIRWSFIACNTSDVLQKRDWPYLA